MERAGAAQGRSERLRKGARLPGARPWQCLNDLPIVASGNERAGSATLGA